MKQIIFSFNERSIKAALVERSGSSFNLFAVSSVQLSQAAVEAGVIKDYNEVKEKLAGLIGQVSEAKSFHIIVLLSEEASFLKVLKGARENNLLDKPELKDATPYPVKQSFTTLRLLKNKDIQFVAAQRESILTYQKVFKEVGLEVGSIIPEPTVFLPFLENSKKPGLIISLSEGSTLYSLISEGGVYFSTTKHFKDGVFDKGKLEIWTREIVEHEVKSISPTYDFEALVFGEREEEILKILQDNNIPAKLLQIQFGKINPQINDFSPYKRLVAAAGLSKQIPGFHIKDINEVKKTKVISPSLPFLPKLKLKLLFKLLALFIIIIGLIFLTPKLFGIFFPPKGKAPAPTSVPQSSPSATIATPATQSASPSAKKEEPKKPVAPKPVLKKSSLKVEVLNGNGTVGAASDMESLLKSKGYNVVSVGNASNYNYASTVVIIKKSKQDFYPLLTKDLASRYTVTKGAFLSEGSSFDAQVIVGKN